MPSDTGPVGVAFQAKLGRGRSTWRQLDGATAIALTQTPAAQEIDAMLEEWISGTIGKLSPRKSEPSKEEKGARVVGINPFTDERILRTGCEEGPQEVAVRQPKASRSPIASADRA
ncbi:MAG: hypothetical protein QM765_27540 [Myxococcales bacterium]